MSATARPDPREFRNALGAFATGVTIITTRAADGAAVGITANSFNSVSLDPPMVLWSLAKSARSLEVFNRSLHWAVHILSAGQQALSDRFARSGADKFAGLDVAAGIGGAPLLHGCSARLQCKTSFQYEGGDHVIFVGEVLDFDRCELPPLVFQSGTYALATRKTDSVFSRCEAAPAHAAWSEDHVGYLLGRAYFQIYAQIRRHARRHGLSDVEYFCLATLLVRDGATLELLNSVLAPSGMRATHELVQGLADLGWLLIDAGETDPPMLRLTERGRQITLRVVAAAEAIEADVLGRFGAAESLSLKNLLRQFVRLTDPGVPDLWETCKPA